MKAITLWQPWASAVALGIKTIETRSWLTEYRGPLAIHAGKRWRKDQERFLMDRRGELSQREANLWGRHVELRGCIIAVVELGAIVSTDKCRPSAREARWGDYSKGRWAWLLKEPVRLETPFPFRGSQTFFTVPDELIDSAR